MVVALSQKSNNPKISKKMVEEILKRKRETIEKLKQRRSIKEAILESKKAGKRPVIAEVKRRGLKAGEEVGGVY